MSIDLNQLSTKQLDTLINQAKKRRAALGKRKPVATIRKKLGALAKAEGYTIAELFGAAVAATKPRKSAAPRRKPRTLGKVAPKYRNPANAADTWAGRGKPPRWLAAEMGKGRKLEEFLIQ